MTHMQQLKGDVFFIQETHLCNREVTRLKRPWIDQLFHSGFNQKARGAAILICKNIHFEPHKTVTGPTGRFVIVSGKLHDTQVILASIYGPNWDDSSFVTKLFTSFPNIDSYHIIVGGDFNFVQDPSLDRSSNKVQPLTKSAKTLDTFAKQLGFSDPWRYKFPTNKLFSFFSHVHCT